MAREDSKLGTAEGDLVTQPSEGATDLANPFGYVGNVRPIQPNELSQLLTDEGLPETRDGEIAPEIENERRQSDGEQ